MLFPTYITQAIKTAQLAKSAIYKWGERHYIKIWSATYRWILTLHCYTVWGLCRHWVM